MSDNSSESQFAAFIDAVQQRSAVRILELGTEAPSFFLAIISATDWASNIELHCAETATDGFDQELIAAAENTDIDFQLIKHAGSETEVNDAILELATSLPFDAIFISNSSSNEALLTSLLVCHESLKHDGVLGLSAAVAQNRLLSDAITSFKDMLGDAYRESNDHIYVRV